jgi:hypothetical protein
MRILPKSGIGIAGTRRPLVCDAAVLPRTSAPPQTRMGPTAEIGAEDNCKPGRQGHSIAKSPTAIATPRHQVSQPTYHLNQIELSRRWRISPRTLERWRWLGIGPRYVKIGGRVVYRLEDIEAFEAARICG